ncbi:Rieske (2Fe-2S) protein [Paenibacillus psychroresistens]|uniref:Rieske (2Fe-2S) protein n=1 Tax=Paenibacillus psychroresistens TaxID=1778678 RepID=A0A6B8RXL8_9BACL|nr:Rieske (2Fe-2S) protein [Paenibacillus psychroresistens]QGQ99748.1 Rieske (2Fe-2S) protein [Paenibacillus psychroresistens]
MTDILIGPIEHYAKFPAEIYIDRKPFYLMEEGEGYTLMSRICPHAGDTVDLEDGGLVCPMHGWTFELHTGRCQHIPSLKLTSYEVHLQEGNLIVKMP